MYKVILVSPEGEDTTAIIELLRGSFRWFHRIHYMPSIEKLKKLSPSMVIIHAKFYVDSSHLIDEMIQSGYKVLLYGENWKDSRQIDIYTKGLSGYCEDAEEPETILQAATTIERGDIWIKQKLISPVINQLQADRRNSSNINNSSDSIYDLLSEREIQVLKLIKEGDRNQAIANKLNITERTVKAHLSSIFNKLNIKDRMHLVVYLQQIGF